MISTFNCAPETRSKHARPVCFFHDMLWSRVSSSGLLALEEVVSVPDICYVLPSQAFLFNIYRTNWRKRLTHSVTFAVALTEPTWIWTTIQIESYRNRISFSCHMLCDFLYFFPFFLPGLIFVLESLRFANSPNCWPSKVAENTNGTHSNSHWS